MDNRIEEPPEPPGSGTKYDDIESNGASRLRDSQRRNSDRVLLVRQPWMGLACVPIFNTDCNFKFLRNRKSSRN